MLAESSPCIGKLLVFVSCSTKRRQQARGRKRPRACAQSTWRASPLRPCESRRETGSELGPNRGSLSLLFSVIDVRKLLIFIAWGSRGPGLELQRPDPISERLSATSSRSRRAPRTHGTVSSVPFLSAVDAESSACWALLVDATSASRRGMKVKKQKTECASTSGDTSKPAICNRTPWPIESCGSSGRWSKVGILAR